MEVNEFLVVGKEGVMENLCIILKKDVTKLDKKPQIWKQTWTLARECSNNKKLKNEWTDFTYFLSENKRQPLLD